MLYKPLGCRFCGIKKGKHVNTACLGILSSLVQKITSQSFFSNQY